MVDTATRNQPGFPLSFADSLQRHLRLLHPSQPAEGIQNVTYSLLARVLVVLKRQAIKKCFALVHKHNPTVSLPKEITELESLGTDISLVVLEKPTD